MKNEAKKVKCAECKFYSDDVIVGSICKFYITRLVPWRAERHCSEFKHKDKEDEKRDNR